MKYIALIYGNGSARRFIQEQRTIELRQAIKRARGVGACLRNPRTLVGIETNNGSADGELGEMSARDLMFDCGLLTRASEER